MSVFNGSQNSFNHDSMVWLYSKPLTSSGSRQGIFFIYLEFTSKDKIPIEPWQILNMMWVKKSNNLKRI